MRKWIKIILIPIGAVACLFLMFATYVYFSFDTRVEINETPTAFQNSKNISRLDSSVLSVDSVTNYIQQLTKKAGVTGLAISIINDGNVVYQNYFGERNHIKRETFVPGTIFYGASFSKTMLADITLQMSDEGLLHLDTPVYTYLKSYSGLENEDRYKKITARMCLTHTTGLPNWRWIEGEDKLKFKYGPGERYSYSGEGMFLLQHALEKISGKDFETLAIEKIFEPLHLDRSSFVWQRGYEGNYAIGHDENGNFLGIQKSNDPNAAGSLSTTLEEYTKYFNTVLNGNESRYKTMTTKQVSIPFKRQFGPEALVETHDNDSIELGYGLGYGVYKTPFGWAFFKEGHGDGWQHYAVGIPDKKLALVIMSNSDNAEGIFKELIEFTTGNRYTPWYWEGYNPK